LDNSEKPKRFGSIGLRCLSPRPIRFWLVVWRRGKPFLPVERSFPLGDREYEGRSVAASVTVMCWRSSSQDSTEPRGRQGFSLMVTGFPQPLLALYWFGYSFCAKRSCKSLQYHRFGATQNRCRLSARRLRRVSSDPRWEVILGLADTDSIGWLGWRRAPSRSDGR
jgi:hypothetical protein